MIAAWLSTSFRPSSFVLTVSLSLGFVTLTVPAQVALGIVFILPVAGLIVFDVLAWAWQKVTHGDNNPERVEELTRDRIDEIHPPLPKSNSSPDLRRQPVLKPNT